MRNAGSNTARNVTRSRRLAGETAQVFDECVSGRDGRRPRLAIGPQSKFSDRRLHIAGERGHTAVQIRLQKRQTRFGAFEAALQRGCRRDGHVGKAGRLLTKLARRLFMKLSKRGPFVLDGPLKILNALGGIVLDARLERIQTAQSCFNFAERFCVTRSDGRPLLENLRAPIGELQQTLPGRLKVVLALSPETEGADELIDLRV